jgi:hypothetical protein
MIVTVATYLLYAVAVIEVINAILTFATTGRMADAVRDAYAGTEAEGAEAIVNGAFVFGAVINLLIGLGFAALGYFNSRGKNPSRIVTWVIGGIAICCFGINLSGNALLGAMESAGTSDSSTWQDDDIQARLDSALPSWFEPTTTALAAISLLAILAVVILLALPASNDFFRKQKASGWDPSTGYPPYPGQPGGQYPAYGQQNPYQQQYPGQGYPAQGAGYPGQGYPGQSHPGPGYPAPQGQPGQPAPGLPPYPGQERPADPSAPPPASDPYARPPASSDPYARPPASDGTQPPPPSSSGGSSEGSAEGSSGDEQPPRPPADPA